MGGKLINIERDKGNDRGHRYQKCDAGQHGKNLSRPLFHIKSYTKRNGQCHAEVKRDLHRHRRQGGKICRNPLGVGAEQAAAAGSDDIRFQAEQVDGLGDHLGKKYGRHEEEKEILLFYQWIIVGPVVGIIEDQPQAGKQGSDKLQNKSGVAVAVEIQCSGRAHGADKERVDIVCRKNIEEQGKELETKDIEKDGGNKVGFSFQFQLVFAAAFDVPTHQNAHPGKRRIEKQKRDNHGREEQGDYGRVKYHTSLICQEKTLCLVFGK